MTDAPTYTAAKAKRLIRTKSVQGEYHVTGSLDLIGCDLKGITLPTTIGGWLVLRGCDLSGITLPTTVGGSLALSGCDLKGTTLPTTIGGSLDLIGAKNPDPSQWWREQGEVTRRHCIAICPDAGYALVQTDTDRFFAGCAKNLTRADAMARWNRTDARAMLFAAAINAHVLETVA